MTAPVYDGRCRGRNRRELPPARLTATRTIRAGTEYYYRDRPEWRITATYHGGAYIDLHFGNADGPAFEVINVWDYAAGKAVIPFRQSAVADRLVEWIEDHEPGVLAHDLPNYAESVGYPIP